MCGFGDCAAHGVPYDSGCGKGFPAYAYSGAAVRAAVRSGVRLGMRYFSALLSHLFTGMPPTAMLPSMLCELAAYGMLSGILIRVIRTKWNLLNLYTALIGAMICGRIINGVLNALIFNAGKYSMEMWLTASFLQAIPGIVIQLALIPLLVLALQKARLANRAGAARV